MHFTPSHVPETITRLPRVALPAIALLLLLPASSATWYSHGSYEPDTAMDAESGFGWDDPPAPGVRNRIYFNAFTTQTGVWQNPNVGAAQTRMETVGSEYQEAILGVWVDCDQDGYVGKAETLVREYPAVLLLDTSVCPPTNGPSGTWNGQHNYNGWVTELIPIAREFTPSFRTNVADARVYRDISARVWGDAGAPDDDLGPTCAFDALPPGSARTTGRILDHADCYLALMIETTSAREYHGLSDAPLGLAEENSGMSTGLRTSDGKRWAGEAHPLERETLGDENGQSMVKVFDCNGWNPTWITRHEPPGSDLDHLYLEGIDVDVDSVNEGGSLAATLLYYTRVPAQDTNDGSTPCGDTEYDNYQETYGIVEDSTYDFYGSVKDGANWNFRWHAQSRGSGAAFPIGPGRAGTSSDLGIEPLSNACREAHCIPSRWYADLATARKLPSIARADLASGTAELAHAVYRTFYAYVGSGVLSRGLATPGGLGVYGSTACGSFTSGIHGGWQCDSDQWRETYFEYGFESARVGDTFQFRDVDCYDGGNFIGVHLGVAAYGNAPCR